jgi:hAT family C-terminal dimerisation region
VLLVARTGLAAIGCTPVYQAQDEEKTVVSEAQRYLAKGKEILEREANDFSPLTFWKDLEPKFPTLASMAKDVLAIPAAGVGCERSFSSERDVGSYRRGRLLGTTIEDIMIVKHYEHQRNPPVQIIEPLDSSNKESQVQVPQPTDEESEEEDASLIWDDEHEENTDQSEVDATSDSDMESDLESVCT